MTLKSIINERSLPDPSGEGSWYWYRKNPSEKWRPVYVHAKTKNYPACVDDVHSTPVANLSGEWHSEIIYPS